MKIFTINSKRIDNPELIQEYRQGEKFGNITLGTNGFFFRSSFHYYYIPYSEVYRYFRRVKIIPSHVCCDKMNLEVEYLVLCDKKQEIAEIQLLNHKVALALMEKLKDLIPDAKVGSNIKRTGEFANAPA